MAKINISEEYQHVSCACCGIFYFVPADWLNEKKRTGDDGSCPNGHSWAYRDTTADILRRERDSLKQQQARLRDRIEEEQRWRQSAERSAAAHKGQVTKLKKRASAGVCPCCNRSFENLRRHMNAKHPDYTKLDVIDGGKQTA